MSGTLRKVHGPRRCAARTTRPNKAAAGFDPVFGELHHVITFKTFARAAAIVLAPLLIAACGVNTIPTKEEKAKAQWAEIGRASCRERVCQSVEIPVVAV